MFILWMTKCLRVLLGLHQTLSLRRDASLEHWSKDFYSCRFRRHFRVYGTLVMAGAGKSDNERPRWCDRLGVESRKISGTATNESTQRSLWVCQLQFYIGTVSGDNICTNEKRGATGTMTSRCPEQRVASSRATCRDRSGFSSVCAGTGSGRI